MVSRESLAGRLLGALCAVLAACMFLGAQTAAPTPSTPFEAGTGEYPMSELFLWSAFLTNTAWLQSQEARIEAAGGRSNFATQLQKDTGLTAREAAAVNSIAADWQAKDAANAAQVKALAANGARRSAGSPELTALAYQRQQNIADHIDQIKAALGSFRFTLVNSYVHRGKTRQAPLPPGGRATGPSQE